jgi:RecB family endonuclease NucS
LADISVDQVKAENLEVLGERALPEGHIDIFIKEAVPIGESKSILIEIKKEKASTKDFGQLAAYLREFGTECVRAVLIAKDFGKKGSQSHKGKITALKYSVTSDLSTPQNFEELVKCVKLEKDISLDGYL